MNEYLQANRKLWNDWTTFHVGSKFYDVEGFKRGKSRLDSVERELGDVRGKSLLHLQCHFGLTTLSWARLGAHVTGVDFSDEAIAAANKLSIETGIAARFVLSNIDDLPDVLTDEFDIVFTSHGVLPWLPDLAKWAQVIAHFLKPGGIFYIVEAHPFAMVFDDNETATDLRVLYDYFHSPEPLRFETSGSYADRNVSHHGVEYNWIHSMSDILNALIAAGLHIDYLHEFPFLAWKMLPFMEQDSEGWWRLPERFPPLPLMFALKANKQPLTGNAIESVSYWGQESSVSEVPQVGKTRLLEPSERI
jgi:SAM-dependent methyltransferase